MTAIIVHNWATLIGWIVLVIAGIIAMTFEERWRRNKRLRWSRRHPSSSFQYQCGKCWRTFGALRAADGTVDCPHCGWHNLHPERVYPSTDRHYQ